MTLLFSTRPVIISTFCFCMFSSGLVRVCYFSRIGLQKADCCLAVERQGIPWCCSWTYIYIDGYLCTIWLHMWLYMATNGYLCTIWLPMWLYMAIYIWLPMYNIHIDGYLCTGLTKSGLLLHTNWCPIHNPSKLAGDHLAEQERLCITDTWLTDQHIGNDSNLKRWCLRTHMHAVCLC